MSTINHSLYNDFPEHQTRIHQLKLNDENFARMATEYHQLDHSIRGLENRGIATSNEQFEQMKRRRLHLKDRLYQMLQ